MDVVIRICSCTSSDLSGETLSSRHNSTLCPRLPISGLKGEIQVTIINAVSDRLQVSSLKGDIRVIVTYSGPSRLPDASLNSRPVRSVVLTYTRVIDFHAAAKRVNVLVMPLYIHIHSECTLQNITDYRTDYSPVSTYICLISLSSRFEPKELNFSSDHIIIQCQ